MKAGYIQPPGGGCFAFERIIGLGEVLSLHRRSVSVLRAGRSALVASQGRVPAGVILRSRSTSRNPRGLRCQVSRDWRFVCEAP